MRERVYQAQLIKNLRRRFPGCVILKNDSEYMQGIPDLSVFHGPSWGMLESKISANAPVQPNQEYYVEQLNEMSFAAFIHPDNEEEILHDLQLTFESYGNARFPKRK